MEGPDHSQLSGAMLAFLWDEFIKRARVPAVAVDIVLLRLGLSLDRLILVGSSVKSSARHTSGGTLDYEHEYDP